jgi:hypothetical protein
VLKALVIRNLKLYFRDRAAVFFSILGVIVMILMYILFLGSLVVQEAEKYAGEAARFFMDSWLMSGIVAATSTTTCLGGFGIMAEAISTILENSYCLPFTDESPIVSMRRVKGSSLVSSGSWPGFSSVPFVQPAENITKMTRRNITVLFLVSTIITKPFLHIFHYRLKPISSLICSVNFVGGLPVRQVLVLRKVLLEISRIINRIMMHNPNFHTLKRFSRFPSLQFLPVL